VVAVVAIIVLRARVGCPEVLGGHGKDGLDGDEWELARLGAKEARDLAECLWVSLGVLKTGRMKRWLVE
jgi:hypothetical protein